MTETYSHTSWQVKPGREAEFVQGDPASPHDGEHLDHLAIIGRFFLALLGDSWAVWTPSTSTINENRTAWRGCRLFRRSRRSRSGATPGRRCWQTAS